METSEMIYIGSDFPDEFVHSEEKIRTRGANEKARANIVDAVAEIIQIATNQKKSEDYGKKHGRKEEYGWYRYDIRFGIPIYNNNGELYNYSIFRARMIVRHDRNGKKICMTQ